jgi:plastocyanin
MENKERPMIDNRKQLTRGAFAAVAALLAICASGVSGAEKPTTYTVQITQMRYDSIPDHLNAGDTIVWVNKDTVQHTVTAKDHSFDIRIAPGKQQTQTLDKTGTFAFYCVYHPTMRGTLKVSG